MWLCFISFPAQSDTTTLLYTGMHLYDKSWTVHSVNYSLENTPASRVDQQVRCRYKFTVTLMFFWISTAVNSSHSVTCHDVREVH